MRRGCIAWQRDQEWVPSLLSKVAHREDRTRLGAHAFVWVGDWADAPAERAIHGAAERSDFVEIPIVRPADVDVDRTRSLLATYGREATCSLALPSEASLPERPHAARAFLGHALRDRPRVRKIDSSWHRLRGAGVRRGLGRISRGDRLPCRPGAELSWAGSRRNLRVARQVALGTCALGPPRRARSVELAQEASRAMGHVAETSRPHACRKSHRLRGRLRGVTLSRHILAYGKRG